MTSRVIRAGLTLIACAAAMVAVAGCGNSSSNSASTASSATSSTTAGSGTIAPGDLDAAKITMMCQELLPVIGQMNKDRPGNSADVINQALSEMPATTDHDKADAQAAAQKALTGKCE